MLYNHHQYLIPDFIKPPLRPQKNLYPLNSHFQFLPSPQTLTTIDLFFVCVDLPILDISNK